MAVETLVGLLGSETFDPVPLGKLRGEQKMALIPTMGCLEFNEIDSANYPDLEYAETNTEAISYADGHPSEDQLFLRVKSDDDLKLRRFAVLGRVQMQSKSGCWEYTGHVLVIDADEGRDHHPWLILATEWPMEDGDMDWDGNDMHHAEKRVKSNDASARGVLPRDKNRTPIARLKHYGQKTNPTKLFLAQLGPDFEFDLVRTGGDRRTR